MLTLCLAPGDIYVRHDERSCTGDLRALAGWTVRSSGR